MPLLSSPVLGVTICSIWTATLFVPRHGLSGLKCSCRVPGTRVFLIAVRCLAILLLSDCAVWPTYCFLHFLQWIRYTTWGVLQFALPCVL